jgi:hypothetical protein
MWPWIKRWRDWAMRELRRFSRSAAHPQALHFSCERAGLTLSDQPIPWSAESVTVEAVVHLPASIGRRKSDFLLRIGAGEPVGAEYLRRVEGEDHYRIVFRLPPLGETVTAELLFRDRVLGRITLPVVSREKFLKGLQLESSTLFVRLGEESIACQTFVASQCRGLAATGVLTSPHSLLPLLDLELQVEFRCDRAGVCFRVPACLTCSQLTARTALVTVVPSRYPRRIGTWTATWMVGENVLARQRIRGISQRAFQKSLRISDTRFVVQKEDGPFRLSLQPPAPEAKTRVGPCFLIASSEPGMAGLCKLQVSAQVPGAVQPPLLLEQQVRITDGPAVVAPGTLEASDLLQVTGFEISVAGRPLGSLSLRPVPEATFTGEGGFHAPPDYTWNAAAEEEMSDRLNRLIEGQMPGE